MIAAITQEIYGKPKAENTPGTFLPAHDSTQRLAVGKKLHGANMDAFLKESPYDPYIHNGARNPYTGDVIVSEDDYKRYAHEHVYSRECEKILRTHYSDHYKNQISSLKGEVAECQRQLKASEESNRALKNKVDALQKETHRLHSLLTPENKLKRDRECIVLYVVCFVLLVALVIVFGLMHVYKQYVPEENTTTQSRVEANLAKPTTAKPTSTPAPQKQSTSTSSDAATTVYITESGSKYHKANCQYLSKSKKSIDLSKAKAQGYEPCSKCY